MTLAEYVGIDVAKAELVVGTSAASLGRFANDGKGHGELVKRLKRLQVASVVMESTGRYGQEVAKALMAAGVTVAVVQPGCVRHFARSLGIRAKTDPIDARVIARFGEATKPRALSQIPEEITQLRALVDRRDQVVELRKQEQNHLEACTTPGIAKELRTTIARLKKLEARYAAAIARHLAAHQRLHRLSQALQSESGVATLTAAALISHLPELGQINRQQVAALSGLAPYDRASGNQDGKRSIGGGRRRLRRALYLAAVTATRFNEWISPMYRRLREHGKCAKVAIIACARKLLIRLNSIAAKVLAAPASA
jgi:transposase